jgi:hypothetical protein
MIYIRDVQNFFPTFAANDFDGTKVDPILKHVRGYKHMIYIWELNQQMPQYQGFGVQIVLSI